MPGNHAPGWVKANLAVTYPQMDSTRSQVALGNDKEYQAQPGNEAETAIWGFSPGQEFLPTILAAVAKVAA